MTVKNAAAPNIMFTLDDSGSMQLEVAPETSCPLNLLPSVNMMFPRPDYVYGTSWNNHILGIPILKLSMLGYAGTPTFDLNDRYARYYRSATFNRLYYDPAKRYLPWINADKTLMANSPPTAAWHNPYNTAEGTRNLTVDNSLLATIWPWVTSLDIVPIANLCLPLPITLPSATSWTFYPATYFKWTGAGTLTGPNDDNNVAGNFQKIEIKPAAGIYTPSTFPRSADRTDCAGSTCTYAEEIQNFANWYSYYRSRILLSRAGVGQAFASIGSEPRVGFAAINQGSKTIDGISSEGTIVAGVRKFDATGRANFYSELYGYVMNFVATPLRQALDDVGVYFSRTDDRGPWGETPGSTGGTQAYCRQSYNILMTDGYWNSDNARTHDATHNVDGSNGSTITNDNTNPNPASYQYVPANPYSDANSDTLADVAMYYWNRDLRSGLVNKVPTNSRDPAFWQHLVNLTVGLGVSGTISQAAIDSAFTGTPQTITWPAPTDSNKSTKVDDLAHAAINSRGYYLNAGDPNNFASALSSTINNILGREAGAAAVAVANANVTGTDNHSYASMYNSGDWSGELFAYPINISTGMPDETQPIWASSAQTQLDARTSADRKIVSYTGTSGTSQGIQFQPASAATATKLSSSQQALLNSVISPPGPSDGAYVVAFLRGDRSREGSSYRTRAHLLGDIINAEPLVVREPFAHYADDCYATPVTGKCATSFKVAKAGRDRMVYQGANDGMLHAFNASSGAEEWAYIPSLLMSALNNLSSRTGFTHKYYVDGTPVSGDVDFSNTDGVSGNPDPEWKTLLVGGLNKGGRGYYALDVTCPTTQSDCTTAANEADIAAKVLWEFPNSATTSTVRSNLGYSYGKPIIVKTTKGWVVLVTSGYNNGADTGGNGQGYLFVLNARTGALIAAIGTGVGTSADPSGLAQISAYVENSDGDNTTGYVYGGDLKGNVWRFDLTASNTSNWTVKRLAVLKDAGGATQPVTTAPELAKIKANGADKRFVYVGTGQYLGDPDVTNTQTQTMYGLIDDLSNPSGSTPVISDPARNNLTQQTLTASGTTRTATANAFDPTKKGWYVDMPASGERIYTDPSIAVGALVFTSNIPSSDVCIPGGNSWINILDYLHGGKLTGSTVAWSSIYLGEVLASRPVLIKLPGGEVKALVRTSAATTIVTGIPLAPGASGSRRVSWKELLN